MAEVETEARRTAAPADVKVEPIAPRAAASRRRRKVRILPLLVTAAAAVLAAWLGTTAWHVYMGAPWTRDGTVRAYVVTMAPEIAGRIVRLPADDNQLVHKGDVLFEIDPA